MRTSTRAAILAGVLATAAASGACSNSTPDVIEGPAADLVGRTFIGDDVTVNDKPYRLVPGSTLRISFDQGAIGASAGCNSMSGRAEWGNGFLAIDGQTLSMTEMGCKAALMDQDTWFADFLTSAPKLLSSDTTLTMTSDDAVIVLADEKTAVPDVALAGTTWRLDSIMTAGSVSSVPSGVESTLQLDDDGALVVFLGCNTGRAAYSVSSGLLTIEPLATTKKACPPPASDVETELAGFLRGDVAYSIDGTSLLLTAREVVGPGPTALVYRASQ